MRVPAVLLATILALSGCAGAGKGGTPSASPTETGDVLPPGVTNVLEGTIRSTDLQPLAGANVTLPALDAWNITDEAGFYQFQNLPPKDYIVVAAMEGFRSKTQRAIIADDAIFQLDFTLENIPLEKPYNTTVPWRGFISCQAAYQTQPDNTARPNCGQGADPNNNQAHRFPISPGAAQVVVEIAWTKRSDGAKILTATLESVGENSIQFAHDRGESGLKLVIAESLLRNNMPQGGDLLVTVESAPSILGDESGLDVGLVVQQDFNVYFTVFYIEPGPHSFSAIPA